ASGPQAKLEVSAPGDAAEVEADAIADAATRGGPPTPVHAAPTPVARHVIHRAALQQGESDKFDASQPGCLVGEAAFGSEVERMLAQPDGHAKLRELLDIPTCYDNARAGLRNYLGRTTDLQIVKKIVRARYDKVLTEEIPWDVPGLKQMYLALDHLPRAHVELNTELTEFQRHRSGPGKVSGGGFYGNKVSSLNYDAISLDAQNTGMGAPGDPLRDVNRFDTAARHEVGHAVDHKGGFSGSYGATSKGGGWKEHPDLDALVDELVAHSPGPIGRLPPSRKQEVVALLKKLVRDGETFEFERKLQAVMAASGWGQPKTVADPDSQNYVTQPDNASLGTQHVQQALLSDHKARGAVTMFANDDRTTADSIKEDKDALAAAAQLLVNAEGNNTSAEVRTLVESIKLEQYLEGATDPFWQAFAQNHASAASQLLPACGTPSLEALLDAIVPKDNLATKLFQLLQVRAATPEIATMTAEQFRELARDGAHRPRLVDKTKALDELKANGQPVVSHLFEIGDRRDLSDLLTRMVQRDVNVIAPLMALVTSNPKFNQGFNKVSAKADWTKQGARSNAEGHLRDDARDGTAAYLAAEQDLRNANSGADAQLVDEMKHRTTATAKAAQLGAVSNGETDSFKTAALICNDPAVKALDETVGISPWVKDMPSVIDGRVYHEAYAGRWVSYEAAARARKVSNYQFRAPGEWFAEAYAAYYEPSQVKGSKLNQRDPDTFTYFQTHVDK
ncbi:MAG TPA: hypothetical protein VF516_15660, partial [Kofleriaceae bacterium]